MIGWQLIFISYSMLPIPLPEIDHAEVKLYPTQAVCQAEGGRQAANQMLDKGVQLRVPVCVYLNVPDKELGL